MVTTTTTTNLSVSLHLLALLRLLFLSTRKAQNVGSAFIRSMFGVDLNVECVSVCL